MAPSIDASSTCGIEGLDMGLEHSTPEDQEAFAMGILKEHDGDHLKAVTYCGEEYSRCRRLKKVSRSAFWNGCAEVILNDYEQRG